MRILIVEDDIRLADNIATMLKHDSYAVDVANNASEASDKVISPDYDLVILDWKLPDGSGIEICKMMREEEVFTPVLILTANSQNEDKVEGLDAGADDYLTKPFNHDELLARVRALVRRKDVVTAPIIKISDLVIDTNLKLVSRNKVNIDLSPREYSLLEYLATRIDTAVSRVDLLSHVWDENANMFSNTVDVHIKYLRDKIDSNHATKLIKTVKGQGYALCSK